MADRAGIRVTVVRVAPQAMVVHVRATAAVAEPLAVAADTTEAAEADTLVEVAVDTSVGVAVDTPAAVAAGTPVVEAVTAVIDKKPNELM